MPGTRLNDQHVMVYAAGLLMPYGALLFFGAAGVLSAFMAAAVLVGVAELAVRRNAGVLRVLGLLGVTPMHRHVIRDVAVLLLIVVATTISVPDLVALVMLVASVWAASLWSEATTVVIRRRFAPSVPVRNVDTSGICLPPPPRIFERIAGGRLVYLNALLVPAATVAALVDSAYAVIAAAAVAAVAAIVVGASSALWLRSVRRAPSRLDVIKSIRGALQPFPEVVLYFGGSAGDVYQVNMWLPTVESLGKPALVVLRERSCFAALAPTSLPVICVPSAVDLMNMGWRSVRLALYPSNTGNNIHMLREPGMKHVFIGHGDSDKVASVNPYSKVYDEVWVAGRAGRDRYATAGVGVRDEDIVEVGRPQLDGILTADSMPPGPFTVLYAPTWEGWIDDPNATSLLLLGERIVTGLLGLAPRVRVWYRPHPLIGSRSREAAAAHRRVVKLIEAAGGGAGPLDSTDLRQLGHHAFTAVAPSLHECFNQSHLLISDVSSVVSDWVASCKPYAVANSGDVPDEQFRYQYPTASAAYLISSSGAELRHIVTAAGTRQDPLADERATLKEYLLGPDYPPPLERFKREVARLCSAATGGGSDDTFSTPAEAPIKI